MLTGQTVLVVEAEFLIALDLQRMLESLGAGQTLFARAAEEAQLMSSQWEGLGLAVIEVRSDTPYAPDLVRRLRDRGIPVVLISANSSFRLGHPNFPDVPIVVKPMSEQDLAQSVASALSRS